MSHYNNNHNNNHNNQDDFVDVDDYTSATGYPLQQRMTPQQQRQEERRRHAEAGTANGAAAAAAGSGASPWLNKQKKKSSKWKTIAWCVLVLVILAVAGVLAWYFAVYKKNNANSGSNNSNNGSNGGNTGGSNNVPATGPTGKQSTSTFQAYNSASPSRLMIHPLCRPFSLPRLFAFLLSRFASVLFFIIHERDVSKYR
jgi:hypothetical protein